MYIARKLREFAARLADPDDADTLHVAADALERIAAERNASRSEAQHFEQERGRTTGAAIDAERAMRLAQLLADEANARAEAAEAREEEMRAERGKLRFIAGSVAVGAAIASESKVPDKDAVRILEAAEAEWEAIAGDKCERIAHAAHIPDQQLAEEAADNLALAYLDLRAKLERAVEFVRGCSVALPPYTVPHSVAVKAEALLATLEVQ